MKPAVRVAYRAAVADYTAAYRQRDPTERAHVLGQRYVVAHIVTHLRMFRNGLARGDSREMLGQLLRLIATIPGRHASRFLADRHGNDRPHPTAAGAGPH